MFLTRLRRIPKAKNSTAFVFYATDEAYAIAVLVFVHLLRDLGIRNDVDLLLLHLPLSAPIMEKFQRLGIKTRLVKGFYGARNKYYQHCYVKLRLFERAEYDRVLFADADAIPLCSLDHLLSLPITAPIAAPPAYWLPQPFWTSALLLARPSRASWKRIAPHIRTARQTGVYDMDILNREFAREIESLPPTAFCLNSEWEDTSRPGYFIDPEQAYRNVSVVHFSALGKPWMYSTSEAKRLKPNAHPLFFELWDRWRSTRDRILH